LPGVIPVTPGLRLLPARDYPVGADQASAGSLARSGVGQAPPTAAGAAGGQPGRKRGRWWETGRAAATPATVPRPTAPSATPQAAAPGKTGPSKRWWER
jgi:hypothetical protein